MEQSLQTGDVLVEEQETGAADDEEMETQNYEPIGAAL